MQEPTVESLKERVAELERQLAERDESPKDWRSVVGLFDDSELMPQILAEGRAYRQRLRDEANAEADAEGLPK